MTNQFHLRRAVRAAAALVAAGALVSCGEDSADILEPGAGGELFTSYVALGNSITAGYQSGGINDSTQRESYAALLAGAAETRYTYASLVMPGCPAPVADFQTQARVGGATATTCALRSPSPTLAPLNNVAVPGARTLDPTAPTSPSSNILTTLVLGGKTQVARALDANPTFFTAWIGNNDVLDAAVRGILVPTPGVTTGVTPLAEFQASYDAMAAGLSAAPNLRGGALIGVVNVTIAPILFPVAALFNPQFRGGFEQFTGGPIAIDPSCGTVAPTSTALLSFAIVPQIRLYRQDPTAAGAHPPVIACARGALGANLVGDIFVLDAEEQASIAASVAAYNAHIQSVATANDWVYVDPNPALEAFRGNGCVSTVPNLASATEPYGPCVSLDGVHPRRPAHVAVANLLIAAINSEYSLSIPSIPTTAP